MLLHKVLKYFHFSLREEIIEFAENLLDWFDESLTEVPLALKEAKFEGWCFIINDGPEDIAIQNEGDLLITELI